jgi:hypothetical protein
VKRLILPAGVALAAVTPGIAAAAVGRVAVDHAPTAAHVRAYERAYHEVAKRFGHRTPGRNIVEDGIKGHKSVTDAEVVASTAVLDRMLAPPPVPAAPTAIASTTVSSTAPVASGAGGVPACASESGTNYSTGPSNTNPSSGATGRYQILPSTAAAYGCNLSTPAGQDACAQTIYANQGAGAWVGCGG